MRNSCLFPEKNSMENQISQAKKYVIDFVSSDRMRSLLSHISSDESSRRIDEVLSEVSDLALEGRYREIPSVSDSIASYLRLFIKREQIETILLIRKEASEQIDDFFERAHCLGLLYNFYAATNSNAIEYLYQAYIEARSISDPKEKIYCQCYILAHIASAKISSSIDSADHENDLDKLDNLNVVKYLRTCGAKQCLSIIESFLDISLSSEEVTSDWYHKSSFQYYYALFNLYGSLRNPAEAFKFGIKTLEVQEKANLFTENSLEILILKFLLVSEEISFRSSFQNPHIVIADLLERYVFSLEKIKEIAGSTPRFYYHLSAFYGKIMILFQIDLERDSHIKNSIRHMNFALGGLYLARAVIDSFERENYSEGMYYYSSLSGIERMYYFLASFSEELRPQIIKMHGLESDFFARCYEEANQSIRKAIQLKIAAGNFVMALPNYLALCSNYRNHNPRDLVNAEQVIREGIECSKKIYAINNNQYHILTLRMYQHLVEICYKQGRVEEVTNLILEVKNIASEMERYSPKEEINSRMISINKIAEEISRSAPAVRP